MTTREFRRLVLSARNSLPRLTRSTMRHIQAVYVRAARDVAKAVAAAEMAGAAEITQVSLASIHRQLSASADDIVKAVQTHGVAGVRLSAEKIGDINDTFISEVFNRSAVTKVDRVVIGQIVVGVNDAVVQSVVNRVWQDGYTFSDRVWRIGRRYQEDIKKVLSAGLAQGRDVLDIARDIQVYTADGKLRLMQRYGGLRRGTREFARRIPKDVDWRALRLVRTELYASLRDAGVQQGLVNPASTGMWDWVRQSSRDWGCECPDYARDGPYTLEALPSTPHSNCLCAVVPQLESLASFNGRLASWADGAPDVGLDEWYSTVYLPAAG